MQINDGSGWLSLTPLSEPNELDRNSSYALAMLWGPKLPGFAAALRLSGDRGHAMFRGEGQEGEGYAYWVDMTAPEILLGKPSTVWLTISPADLSDE